MELCVRRVVEKLAGKVCMVPEEKVPRIVGFRWKNNVCMMEKRRVCDRVWVLNKATRSCDTSFAFEIY